MALDEVDRQLLEALRRDGRTSFEDLGRTVGISRPAARSRVHRMLDDGAVRIETILHPAVAGISVLAHVSVLVRDHAASPVAESLTAFESCPFVSRTAGRFPLVAEIRTADLRSLETELASIRALEGVAATDTALYTDIVKDPYLPLGRPDEFPRFELDELDQRLIVLLRQSPRASYAELAAGARVSRGAARTRVARLLHDGVVAVTALSSSTAAGPGEMCGFALTLGPGPDPLPRLAEIPEVDFAARTIGRCDAVGTITAPDRAHASAALEQLAGLPGVRTVETWWHVQLVKERYSPTT